MTARIVEFLQDRLDEAEAAIQGSGTIAWLTFTTADGGTHYTTVASRSTDYDPDDPWWIVDGREVHAVHHARIVYTEARERARIAAAREVLTAFDLAQDRGIGPETWEILKPVVQAHADVFADHPDYPGNGKVVQVDHNLYGRWWAAPLGTRLPESYLDAFPPGWIPVSGTAFSATLYDHGRHLRMVNPPRGMYELWETFDRPNLRVMLACHRLNNGDKGQSKLFLHRVLTRTSAVVFDDGEPVISLIFESDALDGPDTTEIWPANPGR